MIKGIHIDIKGKIKSVKYDNINELTDYNIKTSIIDVVDNQYKHYLLLGIDDGKQEKNIYRYKNITIYGDFYIVCLDHKAGGYVDMDYEEFLRALNL